METKKDLFKGILGKFEEGEFRIEVFGSETSIKNAYALFVLMFIDRDKNNLCIKTSVKELHELIQGLFPKKTIINSLQDLHDTKIIITKKSNDETWIGVCVLNSVIQEKDTIYIEINEGFHKLFRIQNPLTSFADFADN